MPFAPTDTVILLQLMPRSLYTPTNWITSKIRAEAGTTELSNVKNQRNKEKSKRTGKNRNKTHELTSAVTRRRGSTGTKKTNCTHTHWHVFQTGCQCLHLVPREGITISSTGALGVSTNQHLKVTSSKRLPSTRRAAHDCPKYQARSTRTLCTIAA